MPRTSRSRTATRPTTGKSPLAVRIGGRLRTARQRAGLTQQALAGDRYTKAYISALENALIKPSMVALDYLAGRLGTTASRLMADEEPIWQRLDADLRLAAGDWQTALDSYEALLQTTTNQETRAELLRGSAEALYRLDRGAEAAAAAGEAVEIFERFGRELDAALASYWLSAAMYIQENSTEARAILHALLGKVRAGLRIEPDFKLRLLLALSAVESRDGNHQAALAYLEEIRGLAADLDDRRRGNFLFGLAYSYRETGDMEGALRAGYGGLALFERASARAEIALLENDLALAHLSLGNVAKAVELSERARAHFTEQADERMLAHVTETEAQIEAARGNWPESLQLATRAVAMARQTGNRKAEVSGLLSQARAKSALADKTGARETYEQAAQIARELNKPAMLRRVLGDWADFLAEDGDHKAAYALTREALATS
jgi:transcriptional regulator with XRE-family HTH domain